MYYCNFKNVIKIFIFAISKDIFTFIVYFTPNSCASQPIGLHRNLIFWPTESHIICQNVYHLGVGITLYSTVLFKAVAIPLSDCLI